MLNEFIRQSSELYADDEFKSADNVKACSNCKWHEDFSGACCNGDSEYRADFTNNDFVKGHQKTGVFTLYKPCFDEMEKGNKKAGLEYFLGELAKEGIENDE